MKGELLMNINIKNVGVIQDSSLELKGLTVITGQNNSGKTTVGKILYSIFSAKEDLYDDATRDIIKYAKNKLTQVVRESALAFFFRRYRIYANQDEPEENTSLLNVYRNEFPELNTIEDIQNYILLLCDEIAQKKYNSLLNQSSRVADVAKYINEDSFKAEMTVLIEKLHKLVEIVAQLSDFIFYEKTKIFKTMRTEFNNQISPVRIPDNYNTAISLQDKNEFFEIKIDNKSKKTVTTGYLGFEDISNVIFIDDVTVIDNVSPSFLKYYEQGKGKYNEGELSEVIQVIDHKISLIYKLSSTNDIIESIVSNDSYDKILGSITNILNDSIVIRDEKFVCSSDNLDIANLAMGSKLFAILLMLISNGSINEKTLLILDEPEAHLHPSWQNKLAEIIVLLMKQIGIKILITSHSPNFILALQTYSIKYKVEQECNFYTTQKKEDNYIIDYKRMNDELTKIYADFAIPFSQIKAIYDALSNGENYD